MSSKILKSIAKWLENPENKIIASTDKLDLNKSIIVVEACIKAASLFKKAADELKDGFSTLELASKNSEAYNALPESYQSDDVMVFYYDINGNLCGCPKESEKKNLGDWEVLYNPESKKWVTINVDENNLSATASDEDQEMRQILYEERQVALQKENEEEKLKMLDNENNFRQHFEIEKETNTFIKSKPIALNKSATELVVYFYKINDDFTEKNTIEIAERPLGGGYEMPMSTFYVFEDVVDYINYRKEKDDKKPSKQMERDASLKDLKKKLIKSAGLIDDLLISISSSSDEYEKKIAELDNHIQNIILKRNSLSKLATDVSYEDEKKSKQEQLEKIENSNITKKYKNLEAPLSTRYCPDHPGVMITRIDENTWQCELDKKIYNFAAGFKLENGSKVSGGDVANQTKDFDKNEFSVFDTRESRLNS